MKIDARIQIKVSPHLFRHSYASHLYQNGTNILTIKELLGHKNIANTLIYTHFDSKHIESHKNPLDDLKSKQKKYADYQPKKLLSKRKKSDSIYVEQMERLFEEIEARMIKLRTLFMNIGQEREHSHLQKGHLGKT